MSLQYSIRWLMIVLIIELLFFDICLTTISIIYPRFEFMQQFQVTDHVYFASPDLNLLI